MQVVCGTDNLYIDRSHFSVKNRLSVCLRMSLLFVYGY